MGINERREWFLFLGEKSRDADIRGVPHSRVREGRGVRSTGCDAARGDAIDLGDNRRFPFTITPREIAEDIVQYKQLVADADEMWARGHSYREISDMHRRAARLGSPL
ncbi:MAG TPA: hypothetical protein VGU63_15275 [Candidatus Acidoferrales bacterium]|nr:hypothetical protein [Candidatus Acidoferrales bacterium]